MSSEASFAVPCASVWTLSLVEPPRELPRHVKRGIGEHRAFGVGLEQLKHVRLVRAGEHKRPVVGRVQRVAGRSLSAQRHRAIGVDVDGNRIRVEHEPIRRLRLGDRVIGIDRKGEVRQIDVACGVGRLGYQRLALCINRRDAERGARQVVVALARVCLVDAEPDRGILLDERRT